MQEKKVKKVSTMNVDPSKPAGNGSNASSSNSSSSGPYLANGGSPDRYPSNDLSFPARGIQSLRLPVVGLHLLVTGHILTCYWLFLGKYQFILLNLGLC